MQLTLKDFTRHSNGSPGDHMVANIQQMGDGKTTNDTTDVIIDTTPEHRDIRITDGDKIIKIRLAEDYTVREILDDDLPVEQTSPR